MSDTDRSAFVTALATWLESVMHESMHGFMAYTREHGFSLSQIGALFFVHRHGECGMADVVDDLGVSNAAASQLMDRLVQQGYMNRSEDPADRRAKRLALTPDGERVVVEVVAARQRWFADLERSLTPRERRDAIAMLEVLTKRTRQLKGTDS
jgi:DNA-binding MarR family transcriptional regulator